MAAPVDLAARALPEDFSTIDAVLAKRAPELGITLREIETGLIDFPALVTGRQVWLCWRLGEDDVEWWHELGDGFGGRQALIELH